MSHPQSRLRHHRRIQVETMDLVSFEAVDQDFQPDTSPTPDLQNASAMELATEALEFCCLNVTLQRSAHRIVHEDSLYRVQLH
jgi:hypothetical protein